MAKRVIRRANVGERTFVLELKDGQTRKMTIPGHWKMTFGQLVPHSLRDTQGRTSQIALRLYGENKDDLRAVMTDVVAFREENAIKIMERRTKIKRQVMQKQTKHGMRDVQVEARATEWVNPDREDDDADDIPNEFLAIEARPDVDF